MPTKKGSATMPRRTKAQKKHLAALFIMRQQKSGTSPSKPALEDALAVKTADLKATEAALDYAKGALEDTSLSLSLREHILPLCIILYVLLGTSSRRLRWQMLLH